MISSYGYIAVASPLHDAQALTPLRQQYGQVLERLGLGPLQPVQLPYAQPLVWLLLTGGTEQQTLELVHQRLAVSGPEPILLLAHSGHNSLAAAMELAARLSQEGLWNRLIYLEGPDDEHGVRALKEALGHLKTRQALSLSRLGWIGGASDWLVASTPEPQIVQQIWGPQVQEIPLCALEQRLSACPPEPGACQALAEGACQKGCMPEGCLADSVRVYQALRAVVQEHRLQALSLRCFDLVTKRKMTGCYALSQLNDDGIMAGCEGDLCSTLAMLWAYQLLGQKSWMANPSRLSREQRTLTLAHCTIARSLVDSYSLDSHFESGLGVAIQGNYPLGAVTLLRLGGRALDKLWLAEGTVIGRGQAPDLCRTQIEVQLSQESLETLLSSPLGNHVVVVTGYHAKTFRSYWQLCIEPMRQSLHQ